MLSAYGLANVHCRKGEYGEAVTLYRRAKEAQERTLGAEHRSTKKSARGLELALGAGLPKFGGSCEIFSVEGRFGISVWRAVPVEGISESDRNHLTLVRLFLRVSKNPFSDPQL